MTLFACPALHHGVPVVALRLGPDGPHVNVAADEARNIADRLEERAAHFHQVGLDLGARGVVHAVTWPAKGARAAAALLRALARQVDALQPDTAQLQRFLGERLDLWRRRLGLEDWTIRLDIVGRGELGKNGRVFYNYTGKTAIVVLAADNADPEWILAHELAHIARATEPKATTAEAEERAVDSLVAQWL
jgi:hypothetical protein